MTDALFSVQTEILGLESIPFASAAWGPRTRLQWRGKTGWRAGQGRASPHRDLPAGQEHARIGDPGATSGLQEAWSWLLGTVLVPTTLLQPSCRRTLEGQHPQDSLSTLLSLSSWAGLGWVLAVGAVPGVPRKRRAESTVSFEPLSTLT